jgi:lysophospholipase L1-like esterase
VVSLVASCVAGLALVASTSAGAIDLRAHTSASTSNVALVAVGDSFTAGGGNRTSGWVNWSGTRGGNANDGCGRSPVGYPMLVRTWLSTRPATAATTLAFYACGGATTTDLYKGSPAAKLGLNGASFDRGEVKQLTHVAALSAATVVTVTIGANDVAYFHDAIECYASPRSCSPTSTNPWIAKLRQHLATLGSVLSVIYAQLKLVAPSALIEVVRYPSLFPPAASLTAVERARGCDGFAGSALRFLSAAEVQLNAVIATQARAAGLGLVDPDVGKTGFVGGAHTLCGPTKWFFGRQRTGSFHPNREGQAAIARAVERAVAASGAG